MRRGWKKLYNEELHDLFLVNILGLITPRRVRCPRLVTRTGQKTVLCMGERTLINTSPKLESTIKVDVK